METTLPSQLVDILLVEDSPTDVMLTQEALEHHKVLNTLHVVEDGVEAMNFLKGDGRYGSSRLPGLIILDLNLPRKSGREVLQEIKSDPVLGKIPVVILTTSSDEEDVLRSYGLHANCYIRKPVDFAKFTDIVRTINEFWLGVVTLPSVKA